MVEPLVPLVPLARAEWQRAREAAAAAAVCRDNGYYADAISRAYYAIAHAAKAALALQGVPKIDSHEGLNRLFGRDLVSKNRVERIWSATLKQSHAKRLRADYHATDTFTVDDAQDACDHAAAFLNRIRPLLGNNPAAPPPAL